MEMRRTVVAVMSVTALTLCLLPRARAGESPCVAISAQVIYRAYGYDHIVHLVNRCENDSICDVSTNVNPEPTRVTVPAKSAIDVLTFRGSPARVFTPRATCRNAS